MTLKPRLISLFMTLPYMYSYDRDRCTLDTEATGMRDAVEDSIFGFRCGPEGHTTD